MTAPALVHPCAEDEAGSPEQRLHRVLADELVRLTGTLSELAYDLGSNPDTLRSHMASLQDIDRLTQAHLAIADLLRSDDTLERRVAGITLESLAATLSRRLGIGDWGRS